jgi:dTDP-4-dehydrorhamnose reductase
MDFADRTQLSLDKLAVLESQETIRPDFILNCGAYTAVDKAESENELADINHKSSQTNCSICYRQSCKTNPYFYRLCF